MHTPIEDHYSQIDRKASELYNARYNNDVYRAATADKTDERANLLIDEALCMCGSPHHAARKERDWDALEMVFLSCFLDPSNPYRPSPSFRTPVNNGFLPDVTVEHGNSYALDLWIVIPGRPLPRNAAELGEIAYLPDFFLNEEQARNALDWWIGDQGRKGSSIERRRIHLPVIDKRVAIPKCLHI
jgi:hypothetical protein